PITTQSTSLLADLAAPPPLRAPRGHRAVRSARDVGPSSSFLPGRAEELAAGRVEHQDMPILALLGAQPAVEFIQGAVNRAWHLWASLAGKGEFVSVTWVGVRERMSLFAFTALTAR
ncbi:MAG TPA: hypothetical protein VNR42_10780, partial [Solirubrobacteraceae bacterium]|nr:hypothetical protein [Solirubrobacteraceae bacterium]